MNIGMTISRWWVKSFLWHLRITRIAHIQFIVYSKCSAFTRIMMQTKWRSQNRPPKHRSKSKFMTSTNVLQHHSGRHLLTRVDETTKKHSFVCRIEIYTERWKKRRKEFRWKCNRNAPLIPFLNGIILLSTFDTHHQFEYGIDAVHFSISMCVVRDRCFTECFVFAAFQIQFASTSQCHITTETKYHHKNSSLFFF